MQDEQERRGVWGVCVLISTPFVFIAGSHRVRLLQPTSSTSGEATRGEVEAVGPMGQVSRPVGRSTYQVGQPTPASSSRLSWAFLSDPRWSWPVLACLNWVLASFLLHLSLNRCSDNFCDFMSGQSVLVTCILALKHNLHILKGKVWFSDLFG